MNDKEAESYLDKNVKVVIEPMIGDILEELPDEPLLFMIQWLQKLSGKNSANNMEKEELVNLRKEMAKYKKKYAEHDEEVVIHSDNDDDLLDEEEQDQVDKLQNAMLKQGGKKMRESVSSEVYGLYHQKKEFVAKVVPKSSTQRKRITDRVLQSFLFNNLDDKDLNTVIDAMEEKKFKLGETIIKQGDPGDLLYLIDTGKADCYKSSSPNEGPKFIKTYLPGEAFGELALLYNAPRAATVKAKQDCILWSLDRETFNNIVKTAIEKKRAQYANFLKSIELLSLMEDSEIEQICDALQVAKFKKDDHIIIQGEPGDNFFILEEGEAYATVKSNPNANANIVKNYRSGDYFGELALIRNEPRAASVIAKTDCKLITLDRMTFKRLLGPIENILKRKAGSS